MMKKLLAMTAALLLTLGLAACAGKASNDIVVVSREDGSGTRGAFIELFGVQQKDENGEKIDHTTLDAEFVNGTSVVIETVASNEDAIGYISLGSLNDTVKALQIDGADATVENIKSGEYKIARPFNIATQPEISEAAQAFIDFILSAEGQAVIEDNHYISSVDNPQPYAGGSLAGKVVVAGSSSVTPVMEKLKEAYAAFNPEADIEIQLSDSSTGVNMAIDGSCDIGMASRELKDSELEKGVTPTVIALDGIAIVVNNNNALGGLTTDQVRAVYMGEITDWSELQ